MENKIDKLKESLREFGLTSLSVDNRVSVFFITGIILLFGISSYISLPKESFPEIPFPQVFVNTVYFGNAAEDIESLVTRPLEKEIGEIADLKVITSSSFQDMSLIVAEFNSDVDMDVAIRKLKDAVDRAKPELPADLTADPEILEVNLSELPIMTVNLAGPFSNDELNGYAEYLQEKIKDLPEISDVVLKGVMDKEVAIEVDLPKMEATQTTYGDIANALRQENLTMSGGELVSNDFRRTISIVGEMTSVKDFENLIIKSERMNPVYLKDIARVSFGFQERTSIARSDLEPVISLDIIKKSGKNLLIASDKIKAEVEAAQAKLFPENLNVTVFNDQSIQTRMMVDNLQNSIISGILLVVVVLLFFLGTRNSLFVGIAIPLSMLMGMLIFNIIGYTLNMVLLFSLILALGMLVDNAIVVVENIYRYRQNGYSGGDAAKYGTGEVALPIIASTATTLAAFLPLAFWPGLMGEFMRYLPITLIVVLTSSLFVALVINPVLTASFMKIEEKSEDKKVRRRKRRNILIFCAAALGLSVMAHFTDFIVFRNLLWIATAITLLNVFVLRDASIWFQNKVLPVLEGVYNKFIRFALRKANPYLIFLGTIGLLISSVILLGVSAPKVELFPVADPLFVNAFIELPIGKDIEATDKVMMELEKDLDEIIKPYRGITEAVLSQIGENTSDPSGPPQFGASPNRARLTVSFVPSEERGDLSSKEVMDKIREGLRDRYPGVQIVVDQNSNGPPIEKDINIEVTGDETAKLVELGAQIIAFVNSKNIGGIEELKKDINLGKPEMLINVDREAARRYEVSTYAIADAIRTSVFGKEVSKFKEDDEEYPVTLRLAPDYRYDIDDLLNQKITFRSMASGRIHQIPISAIANVSYSSTYNSINRKDQERMVTITSNVLKSEGYNPNEVVNNIKESLADFDMPEGYKYSFTGGQQQQAEEGAFIASALMIALFLILIILVMQFNSITSPIIILISVIFSLTGVLFGYVLSGMDFVIVMSGVGIISLAGIVVNNAIVLIDYTNLLVQRTREKKGLATMNDMSLEDIREAIVAGGATRLRPVLLTAITTVLGLIPLAIGFNFDFAGFITNFDPNIFIGGDNADFWGVMAWTVIYGLIFATFLTLVVVPVMYWLAYKAKRGFANLF